MFTPQKGISQFPSPCAAHILSSALIDSKIDLLTTDKTSDAEPIRRKLPKGRKNMRVMSDQSEALLWPNAARMFEVLIKIHME